MEEEIRLLMKLFLEVQGDSELEAIVKKVTKDRNININFDSKDLQKDLDKAIKKVNALKNATDKIVPPPTDDNGVNKRIPLSVRQAGQKIASAGSREEILVAIDNLMTDNIKNNSGSLSPDTLIEAIPNITKEVKAIINELLPSIAKQTEDKKAFQTKGIVPSQDIAEPIDRLVAVIKEIGTKPPSEDQVATITAAVLSQIEKQGGTDNFSSKTFQSSIRDRIGGPVEPSVLDVISKTARKADENNPYNGGPIAPEVEETTESLKEQAEKLKEAEERWDYMKSIIGSVSKEASHYIHKLEAIKGTYDRLRGVDYWGKTKGAIKETFFFMVGGAARGVKAIGSVIGSVIALGGFMKLVFTDSAAARAAFLGSFVKLKKIFPALIIGVKAFALTLKTALVSTGVGVLVVALGALYTFFTKITAGTDALAYKLNWLTSIFDTFTGAVAKVFKAREEGKGWFDAIGEGFSGFTETVREGKAALDEHHEALKQIAAQISYINGLKAQYTITAVEKGNVINDSSLSIDERIGALKDLQAAQAEITDAEISSSLQQVIDARKDYQKFVAASNGQETDDLIASKAAYEEAANRQTELKAQQAKEILEFAKEENDQRLQDIDLQHRRKMDNLNLEFARGEKRRQDREDIASGGGVRSLETRGTDEVTREERSNALTENYKEQREFLEGQTKAKSEQLEKVRELNIQNKINGKTVLIDQEKEMSLAQDLQELQTNKLVLASEYEDRLIKIAEAHHETFLAVKKEQEALAQNILEVALSQGKSNEEVEVYTKNLNDAKNKVLELTLAMEKGMGTVLSVLVADSNILAENLRQAQVALQKETVGTDAYNDAEGVVKEASSKAAKGRLKVAFGESFEAAKAAFAEKGTSLDTTELLKSLKVIDAQYKDLEGTKKYSEEEIESIKKLDAALAELKEELLAVYDTNRQLIRGRQELASDTLLQNALDEETIGVKKNVLLAQDALTKAQRDSEEARGRIAEKERIASEGGYYGESERNADAAALIELDANAQERKRILAQAVLDKELYFKSLADLQKDYGDNEEFYGELNTKKNRGVRAAMQTKQALVEKAKVVTKIQEEIAIKQKADLVTDDKGNKLSPYDPQEAASDQLRLQEAQQDVADSTYDYEKAKQEKIRQLYMQSAKVIIGTYQQILAAKQAQLDSEIDIQQNRVEAAVKLAELGNAKTLEAEVNRLDALIEKKEEVAKKEQALQAIQIIADQASATASAISAIAGSFKEGLFVGIATSIALGAQLASMSLTIGNLFSDLPKFDKGTERTGSGRIDSKGGFLSVLHPNERVLSAKDNNFDLPNSEIPKAVEFYKEYKMVNTSTRMTEKAVPDHSVVKKLTDMQEQQWAMMHELTKQTKKNTKALEEIPNAIGDNISAMKNDSTRRR